MARRKPRTKRRRMRERQALNYPARVLREPIGGPIPSYGYARTIPKRDSL